MTNNESKISSIDIAIATSPNDIEAVPGLLKDITANIESLAAGGNVDRQHLLTKCRTMVQALETPRETMIKHCWAQVSF
jgi:hypothetical protein